MSYEQNQQLLARFCVRYYSEGQSTQSLHTFEYTAKNLKLHRIVMWAFYSLLIAHNHFLIQYPTECECMQFFKREAMDRSD